MKIWPFKKKDRFYPYNKVFGIGYPKTGTLSLADALRSLGFNTLHDEILNFPNALMTGDLTSTNNEWDACLNVYQKMFKTFDEQYPQSKFILTTRNPKTWIKSYQNWTFGLVCGLDGFNIHNIKQYLCPTNNPSHIINTLHNIALYGCISSQNTLALIKQYKEHNLNVIRYFKRKPNQLLVLKLESKNKYKQICEFLHKDVPNNNYPHHHKLLTEYIN